MSEFNKNLHYGFLPGCSLSSYNPEAVKKTVRYLREVLPNFSPILKCCGKPTRDIGEMRDFEERFSSLLADIKDCEVDKMILTCPNCKANLDSQSDVETISLWEVLAQVGLPAELKSKAVDSDVVFTIHDSCATRYERKLQNSVRFLLDELGYQYVESDAAFENTRCCGFGGQVNTVNPDMAKKVLNRRLESLKELPVVTYCSTCRSAMIQGGRSAWHILDLIWSGVVTLKDIHPEDVLVNPKHVWHNRFEVRKEIMAMR